MYEGSGYRQYNAPELYVRQGPRARSNMYDVRKRNYEFYPEMRQNRDPSFEVVLDPKSRKAVALYENSVRN